MVFVPEPDFSTHPFLEDYKCLQSVALEGVIARQTLPSAVQFLFEITKPHNIEYTKNIIQTNRTYTMILLMRIKKHSKHFMKQDAVISRGK